MKYITVKLTEEQIWEIDYQIERSIKRLEEALTSNTVSQTVQREIAFQQRILDKLRKARVS